MSKNIKLLSVIETLGSGGAERVLVNTLPELKKIGIECEVAILFDKDDLAKELELESIKVHRMYLSNKWNIIKGVYRLNNIIKKNCYNIIHAHLFFAYFYTGLVKILHPSINTATTFHNLGYNTYPANTLWKKIRKRIDSFIVNKLIDNKIAVSNATKNHYAYHLNIDNVDLISNSFPLSSINTYLKTNRDETLKKYVDIKKFQYFSITPGRLVKEKGHEYLIEAIQEVNENTVGLCHFIVGSGPLKDKINTSIRKKKLTNIIQISCLAQNELFELVKACDFVIVPSISEGFGMVIGEAMALEKPCVATEINGIVDLVENGITGLLVPSRDSKALAEKIERLCLNKDLRNKLSKNAKENIKKFDTENIAKQWKVYYEGVVK